MSDRLFARQLENGLWQWRRFSDGDWATGHYDTGDNEALADSLRGNPVNSLCLILPGQVAVSTVQTAEVGNRKQLQKLIPFEMEDQVIDSIDDLHFLLGVIEKDKITVVYAKAEVIKSALEELESVNCEVTHCVPDYLLLLRENDGATLLWEDNRVHASLGRGLGFTIEANIAPMVVAGIGSKYEFTATVNVVAETEENANLLASWLPGKWKEENGPEIIVQTGSYWDWVDGDAEVGTLNFRTGKFARQLPIARWWQNWKTPVYVAAAAYAIAVTASLSQYLQAKNEHQSIVSEMNAVYLEAVPNGRPGDPVRALKSLVQGMDGKSDPTNLMFLLDGMSGALAGKSGITMSSFRYNGDQKELRFNLEAKSFADLENLRSAVVEKGFEAELLRVTAEGDVTQASMRVTEAKS